MLLVCHVRGGERVFVLIRNYLKDGVHNVDFFYMESYDEAAMHKRDAEKNFRSERPHFSDLLLWEIYEMEESFEKPKIKDFIKNRSEEFQTSPYLSLVQYIRDTAKAKVY